MRTTLRYSVLGLGLAATVALTFYTSETPSNATLAPAASSFRPAAPKRLASEGRALSSTLLDLSALQRRTTGIAPVDNLFISTSWIIAAPRTLLPPSPSRIAAPVTPPLPFKYVGRIQVAPNHWRYFLTKDNQLYIVTSHDVMEHYRIEGIQNGIMQLTYLPLNSHQSLNVGDDGS